MKTKENEKIEALANDVIQLAAEARGTLQVIDELEEHRDTGNPDSTLWAIRHAYRALSEVIEAAAAIGEVSEKMRRDTKRSGNV